ncbi:MAG: AAA family ATPase [Pyrinomonadaceae bacterium]|nr:AAA family ATPase [Pyrinomonadaceae bacterium]
MTQQPSTTKIDAEAVRQEAQELLENDFEKIGFTFGELLEKDLPPREEIIFGLARGEVGLLNATTNTGKTTLLRNLMISLCVGKPFLPFGNFSLPKRVAFLDFEDTLVYLRKDLTVMLEDFSDADKARLKDNVLLVCEHRDENDEDLTLSKVQHLALLTQRLKNFAPDLIIVDTLGSAFQIRSENDNAEIRRFVMRPLRQLARDVGSALICSHHIGKPKLEEGQVKDAEFRGRGASSLADLGRIILNLERDNANECSILRCAKVKGVKFTDTKLKLDISRRWFEKVGESQIVTNYALILEEFDDGKNHTTGEIVEKLSSKMSERLIKDHLALAVSNGHLSRLKHGIYQKKTEDLLKDA